MSKSLTIIIPVFNEEDNLLHVKTELTDFINNASVSSSVLFVNDGSTDNSLTLIKSICDENSAFNYISLVENCGLSAALKAGFDVIESDLIGYIDADLQTTPKDFELLLGHVENFELVTGIRFNRKDSFIKKMSSRIANSIRRLFTNDGMNDTGCPLKIIHSSYAKRLPMFKGMHRFIPALILLQKGRIKQIPVRHFPRTAGYSKFSFKNRFFGPLIDCFAYLWMKKKYINYTIEEKK